MDQPAASEAASLACADEVFLRCAPELLQGEGELRHREMAAQWLRLTAARVIERDKADLVAVLGHLAESLAGQSVVNRRTGEFTTLVEPEWFEKLQRAVERHTGRRVEF